MKLDLWWNWFLIEHGWRKKCLHKDEWQVLRNKSNDGIKHMICVGCLRGYIE